MKKDRRKKQILIGHKDRRIFERREYRMGLPRWFFIELW